MMSWLVLNANTKGINYYTFLSDPHWIWCMEDQLATIQRLPPLLTFILRDRTPASHPSWIFTSFLNVAGSVAYGDVIQGNASRPNWSCRCDFTIAVFDAETVTERRWTGVDCCKIPINTKKTHLPYHVVDTNDALWLLLLIYNGSLGHNPCVASAAAQESILLRLHLTFAQHCKKRSKQSPHLI